MSARSKHALTRDGVLERDSYLLQKPFAVADLLAKLEELLPSPSGRAPRCALGSV